MSSTNQQDTTNTELSEAELTAMVIHNIGNTLTGLSAIAKRYQRSYADLQRLSDKLASSAQKDLTLAQSQALLQSFHAALQNIMQAQDNPSSLLSNQTKLLTGLEHLKGSINLYHDTNIQVEDSQCFNLQQSIHASFSLLDIEGIQTQINCPTGWQLKGPQNLFMQMLLNALKNAIEAIYQRQQSDLNFQPLVQIDVEEIAPEVEQKLLQLTISDNGCGISEENKVRILDMGYTTKSLGSGIGLSSIADIARQFQGHINLTSKGINQGACLTITLPKYN